MNERMPKEQEGLGHTGLGKEELNSSTEPILRELEACHDECFSESPICQSSQNCVLIIL